MDASRAVNYASIWWLNPIVAGISTRGSSEGLLAIIVVAILWCVQTKRLGLAGCLLGLAVHFKIYPFIYATSIVLALGENTLYDTGKVKHWLANAITVDRVKLALFSFITFMGLNVLMYQA